MDVEVLFQCSLDALVSEEPTQLLSEIVRWISEHDPRCVGHPHGFYVVPLSKSPTEDWRFHLWQSGKREILGIPAFIHNHDCLVSSRILLGELTNVVYDLQVDHEGDPLYEVQYSGDRYQGTSVNTLRRTGASVRVVEKVRDTYRQGGAYHVPRLVFHQALVPEFVMTATLVCMHGRSPGPVAVVGLNDHPHQVDFLRSEHSSREILTKFVK